MAFLKNHYSSFLALKLSHPAIKDRNVLCVIIGEFSSSRMLDGTRLLEPQRCQRSRRLFHQQSGLRVQRSRQVPPGWVPPGARLQRTNASSHGRRRGRAGAGLPHKHPPAAGQPAPGNTTQLVAKFQRKERSRKPYHTLAGFFLQYFNTALKC